MLTLQLLEMGVPVVVVANMMDLVKERNLHLDIDGLSRELDCPVVPMSASKGKGLKALKSMVLEKIEQPEMSKEPISRPPPIQQALPEISALLEEKTLQTFRSQHSQDWFCQSLLESDQSFDTLLGLSNSAQSELLVLRSNSQFFLLAIYLTFIVRINLGGAFIDFFDQFTGAVTVDGLQPCCKPSACRNYLLHFFRMDWEEASKR